MNNNNNSAKTLESVEERRRITTDLQNLDVDADLEYASSASLLRKAALKQRQHCLDSENNLRQRNVELDKKMAASASEDELEPLSRHGKVEKTVNFHCGEVAACQVRG